MQSLPPKQGNLAFRAHLTVAFVVALLLAFYAKTLAPSIMWGDPAKLTLHAYRGVFTVCAENHLLRSLIGWMWGHLPFQDYAYGQNLLSALFASLTVGVVYYIVFLMTERHVAAVASALAFGVSHTFWWLAVIAESYSLLFFLLSICIFSALKWRETKKNRWLYIFSIGFGLGITVHAIMPLFAPAFILFFLLEEPRFFLDLKRLVIMFVAFVLGLTPLIGVFIYSLQWHTPAKLIYLMTEDSLMPYLDMAKFFRELLFYPAYLFYQFPFVGFLSGLIGMRMSLKKDRNLFALLVCIILLDVVFSAVYMHARQFEIIVPSYMAFAIAIGIGIDHFLNKLSQKKDGSTILKVSCVSLIGLSVLLPIIVYYSTPLVIRHFGLNPLGIRYMPYRDNARYFFLPDKSGYEGAIRYGREVMTMLPEDAVILADFSPGTVLEYAQSVKGLRPDIKIIGVEFPGASGQRAVDVVREYYEHRPIYFTDYHPYPQFFGIEQLSENYDFISRGKVYEVIRKVDTSLPNDSNAGRTRNPKPSLRLKLETERGDGQSSEPK